MVIVDESGSESSSDDNDNSNVIYIRRKKKKPQSITPPPPAQPAAPQSFAPANPFFTYNWSHKNFQWQLHTVCPLGQGLGVNLVSFLIFLGILPLGFLGLRSLVGRISGAVSITMCLM